MKNKIISIFTIVVLITCFYSNSKTKAETLEEQQQSIQEQKQEAQEKLEYVQDELSSAIVEIQELDDTITNAEQQIATLNNEINELETKIEEITNRLTEIEKQYIFNEELMEERLVTAYETGDVTYLEILLNSASILDFLSNYYTIQELIESDIELLDELDVQKEEIEKSRSELEEQRASLKLKKAKNEQLAVITQNNKTLKEEKIASLSEEEQELQQKIEEYKEEESKIEALIQLATNGYEYSGDYTGGIMAWPIAKSGTYITSGYGIRQHPIQGVIKQHTGIDIGNAGYGAPVIAAADGVVTMAGYYGGYGNCVIINHGNGIVTLYGHGQTILTEVGAEVKKGDLIMEVGSTGNSTGPHLHFEVRVNGTATNPLPYLQASDESEEDSESSE
jgi:murein DD-endopeptidase MepM/ murein hydrolase activator NlpD